MTDVETLIQNLGNHIAVMAPHQRERLGGRLMIAAAEQIKQLKAENDMLKDAWADASKTIQTYVMATHDLLEGCDDYKGKLSVAQTEIERLKAENERLDRELMDYSEDFATLGLPPGSVYTQLLVKRDQERKLIDRLSVAQCEIAQLKQKLVPVVEALEKTCDEAHGRRVEDAQYEEGLHSEECIRLNKSLSLARELGIKNENT